MSDKVNKEGNDAEHQACVVINPYGSGPAPISLRLNADGSCIEADEEPDRQD